MERAQTAGQEWRAHWPLVLAAAMGMSFSTVVGYSLGVFIEPLSTAFGWSRTQVTAGMLMPGLISVPLTPVVGAFIDKWGTRRLALPGLLLGAAALGALGFANGSMVQWMIMWSVIGLVGLLIKPTIWSAAASSLFTTSRGLALGVVLGGVALTQIVAPPLSEHLISTMGWRYAYFALAAGWGGLAFVLAVFFMFDAIDKHRLSAPMGEAAAPRPILPGLTFGQALRSAVFYKLLASTLIYMLLTGSIMVHQVPILTEAGISRPQAAFLAGLSGVAALAGKLIAGWLSDYWNARYLGALTLAAPAIAYACLLEPLRTPALVCFAVILIGYSTGTKVQICAYLTGRYMGLRSFGKTFGIIASLFTIGTSVSAIIASAIYDHFGSYKYLFIVSMPLLLVSGFLILSLGKFPVFAPVEEGKAS